MKVTMRQSGGVAGLSRMAVVDTDTLGEDEARELRGLVARAELEESPSSTVAGRPDARSYRLVIEDAGKTREYMVEETAAGPAVRALLRFLDSRATFVKRKS